MSATEAREALREAHSEWHPGCTYECDIGRFLRTVPSLAALPRDALRRYGRHDNACAVTYDKPCDCGLEVALAALPDDGRDVEAVYRAVRPEYREPGAGGQDYNPDALARAAAERIHARLFAALPDDVRGLAVTEEQWRERIVEHLGPQRMSLYMGKDIDMMARGAFIAARLLDPSR